MHMLVLWQNIPRSQLQIPKKEHADEARRSCNAVTPWIAWNKNTVGRSIDVLSSGVMIQKLTKLMGGCLYRIAGCVDTLD
jgi:hypothetical protein